MTDYIAQANKDIEAQTKKYKEDEKKALEESNRQHDEKLAAAERSVNESLKKTDDDYIDIINASDLQKELDLRNIRETRANMGLSRSGLSSTEQTAAILSAGNKTAEAQRQRQAAVDALRKGLEDYKISVEDSRRSAALGIEQSTTKNIAEYSQDLLKEAYDATATELKSQNELLETGEKNRRSTLKSLWNNGEGQIETDIYIKALEDGWSPSSALEYQKNKNDLDVAFENGLITKDNYDDAIANGYTAESVIASRQRQDAIDSVYSEAKKLVYNKTITLSNGRTREVPSPDGKRSAAQYLISTGLSSDEVFSIAKKLGLSDDDFKPSQINRVIRTETSAQNNGAIKIPENATTANTTS